jgi:hypothetical protein
MDISYHCAAVVHACMQDAWNGQMLGSVASVLVPVEMNFMLLSSSDPLRMHFESV